VSGGTGLTAESTAGLRGGAAPRRRLHPARRPRQPGVVREPRPLRPASSPSTCSPAAAASPTTTCGCATPASPSRWSGRSAARPARPRCSPRSGCAA
jgi:hypothetical protein